MRAEDIVAVTFTRRSAADIKDKLESLRVPMPTVLTMDAFVCRLVNQICERAKVPHVTWLCLKQADREAKLADANRAEDFMKAAQYQQRNSLEELMLGVLRCPSLQSKDLQPLALALLYSAQKVWRKHGAMARTEPTDDMLADLATEMRDEWPDEPRHIAVRRTPALMVAGSGWPREWHVKQDILRDAVCAFAGLLRNDSSCSRAASLDFDKELLAIAMLRGGAAAAQAPVWITSSSVTKAVAEIRTLYAHTYFVVDEFQDTSPAQLALFSALAADADGGARLTVVGDSDQSIYGFRGAHYATLEQQFSALAPTQYTLSYNYRSTPAIIAACRALIARNYAAAPERMKHLTAGRHTVGMPVRAINCTSEAEEHAAVLASIRGWHAAGVPLHHMAVLFRKRPGEGGLENFMRFLATERFSDFHLLSEQGDGARSEVSSRMAVGTVHSAKGLEWDIVFVVGAFASVHAMLALQERLRKPNLEALRQEERRVLYVAASRARHLLVVTSTKQRTPFWTDMLRANEEDGTTHVLEEEAGAAAEASYDPAQLYGTRSAAEDTQAEREAEEA